MKQIKLIFFLLFIYSNSIAADTLSSQAASFYMGIGIGTWKGTAGNKALGTPPILGLNAGFSSSKGALGFSFNLLGWPGNRTAQDLQLLHQGKSLTSNSIAGVQITVDYARVLWRKRHFAMDVSAGAGFGRLSYHNPDVDTDIGKSSLLIMPGSSLRYYIGGSTFLQLKLQYSLANYHKPGIVTPSLNGHYIIARLIVGTH